MIYVIRDATAAWKGVFTILPAPARNDRFAESIDLLLNPKIECRAFILNSPGKALIHQTWVGLLENKKLALYRACPGL
jgi:hypothetical protein